MLNPATLDTLWTYQTHQGGYLNAAPIFKNGIIYAGASYGDPGQVTALNAETGKVEVEGGLLGQEHGFSEWYLVCSLGGNNGGFGHQNRSKVWGYNFKSAGGNNLAYLNGYLYHAHGKGLYIFNAKTEKVAAGPIYAPDGGAFYNVSAGNGRIFIETSFHLYCYKAYSGDG